MPKDNKTTPTMQRNILLSVTDWDKTFENNRTRELKRLQWVPVPNSMDGDGYTELVDHPDGAAHLGVWLVILEIASKCEIRGTLVRSNGKPHDARSLSRMSHLPATIIIKAVQRLVDIGWLTAKSNINNDPAGECDNPAGECDNPAPSCDSSIRMEWNGIEENGREEKGREEKTPHTPQGGSDKIPYAEILLDLNEQRGRYIHGAKGYRVTDSVKKLIRARWEEGFTVDDFRLVHQHQCIKWGNNPEMRQYLRPETLYSASKMQGYLNTPPNLSDQGIVSQTTERAMANIRAALYEDENG